MVSTKLTYADYLALPGDERYELLDGELVLVASPNEPHQRASLMLTRQLLAVEDRGLGRIYVAPFDVLLSDTEVVQPDLMFISQERADIITHANVQGAPDLVVEILSPSTANRDWTHKREMYAMHGVKELWIVDPDAMIVWVMLLKDGEFELTGVYGEGQSFSSHTLEGLTIDLDNVFQRPAELP